MNALIPMVVSSVGCLIAVFACGSDEPPPPAQANTGSSCTADNQCFAALDGAAIKGGAPLCLTRASGDYCTHHCGVDTDCCAVSGECPSGLSEVCASFESTGELILVLTLSRFMRERC